MADNPFESPNLSGTTAPSRPNGRSRSLEEARFTPIMDMYMVGMRPWLKFLGVVGIILAALVILGAVLAFLGGLIGAAGGDASGIMLTVMSLMYVLIGAIYAYPAWQMLQSSSRIQAAMTADDGESKELVVEEFFRHQQNLWRFMGILALVVLSLYFLLFLLVCLGTSAGLMSTGNF